MAYKRFFKESRIRPSFRMSDRVMLTDDALDTYGHKYKDLMFTISKISLSERDHPGFDTGVGQALYDFNNSVYDYELKMAWS